MQFLRLILITLILASNSWAGDFAELPSDFQQSFEIQPIDGKLMGRIIFSATVRGYERIFVLDLDAKKVRKIIDGPGNNSYPRFSPDGTKIIFTSTRDGKRAVYIADWDGGNQNRLTSGTLIEDQPSWSSDGKSVIYIAEKPGDDGNSNIYTIDVESKKSTQLTNLTGKNILPYMSPDNKSVLYNTNRFWPGWDICLWSISSKSERCPLGGNQTFCRAQWDHAGKRFVYSGGSSEQIDLFVSTLGEKEQKQLTEIDGKEYDAAWSPDDSHILFVADTEDRKGFNLYITDFESEKPQPLIISTNSIRFPDWSKARTIELEAKRIVSQMKITPSPEPTVVSTSVPLEMSPSPQSITPAP